MKEPSIVSDNVNSSLRAGMAYFSIIFLVGFFLGTIRTIVLAPRLGETISVSIEVPIILLSSWFVSRRLISKFRVGRTVPSRMLMGSLAFMFLMLAEFGFSVIVFGVSADAYLASLRSPHGLLGFFAQVGFALIPTLQLRSVR